MSLGRAAWAGLPTDQLKGAIDRVVKTLEDPSLKGEGKVTERRQAVRKIANDIFDFTEIARRSLARHWQPLTDAQREEFVDLFSDLLERSYISKIELYGGEKILYTASASTATSRRSAPRSSPRTAPRCPSTTGCSGRATAGWSTTSTSRA